MVLVYGRGELHVYRFINLNFQFDIVDRMSTLGFVFIYNGGVVSWKSSKQEITVDSSTEAKYIVACDVAKEVVWMMNFIFELEVVLTIELSITLYCDNN